ncbi:MAG TPA: hypothetical protein VJ044_16205 [Candidatus Hodarchaeales archaeon]|nr:hypothetical protein [Candidatus Hodarchaeales archaeon]
MVSTRKKVLGQAESKTAVILAGGDPSQLTIPGLGCFRPLVPILGKTLIEDIVVKIRTASFDNIFVLGRSALIDAIYGILRKGDDFNCRIE